MISGRKPDFIVTSLLFIIINVYKKNLIKNQETSVYKHSPFHCFYIDANFIIVVINELKTVNFYDSFPSPESSFLPVENVSIIQNIKPFFFFFKFPIFRIFTK